jgi:hypothetical protein
VVQHKLIFLIFVATPLGTIFFLPTLKGAKGFLMTHKTFSWFFWLFVADF